MARFAIVTTLTFCVFLHPLAAQPQAPYGLTQIIDDGEVTFCWLYPAVNESTLVMFDSEPVSYYFYSSADVGARVATVFALSPDIAAIASVDIFLWPNDPLPEFAGGTSSEFELAVSTALPSDTIVAPVWQVRTRNSHPGVKNWSNFPVRLPIAADSAYIEFRWLKGTPTAPLPGVVYCDRFYNSYQAHRQGSALIWEQIYDSAVLMRLHVARYDLASIANPSGAIPDSFCVYILDSPDESGGSQPLIYSLTDSLHLTLDHNIVAGKFVTVAAWKDNLISPKSNLLKVDISTSVDVSAVTLPAFELAQNYPNPFNATTTICSSASGNVEIYDLLGRKIRILSATATNTSGKFSFEWDGKDASGTPLTSGVYFYRQIGQSAVRKMLLLK